MHFEESSVNNVESVEFGGYEVFEVTAHDVGRANLSVAKTVSLYYTTIFSLTKQIPNTPFRVNKGLDTTLELIGHRCYSNEFYKDTQSLNLKWSIKK